MPALHIRNVPEAIMAALRERAAAHDRSMQQELLAILEDATAEPLLGRAPPPIRLVTVKTPGRSTWRREETYGGEGR
jgi:plasmid stability protein